MSIGELNAEDLDGLVGRELDGRYVLDQFVARGGFGAVYRGIDKKFNLPVAVKVGFSYREFMKEAKLAAEVRHDNIVQVSDYGNDNGLAYLVMEFLQGDDLERLFIRQGKQLTPEQLRKFVSEVGDALAHAHADHLIHRDLKPRNIILKEQRSKSGATSHPARFVLLDFGIAAKLDAEGTQRNRTQDGAGTVEYMAPELLKVAPVATPQSDIYAFGVLLYQVMTGQVPFPQSDTSHMALAACLNAIGNSPPPPFAAVAPDRKYPAAVEELVMQCLAKDPANRPQTMTEVRDRFLAAYAIAPKRQVDYSQTIRPSDLAETSAPGEYETAQPLRIPAPPRSSALWPWLVVTGICMISVASLVLFPEYWYRPRFDAFATLTVDRGDAVDPVLEETPLVLTAGESLDLTFAVEDLPHGTAPEFEAPDPPAGLKIDFNRGPIPATTRSIVVSAPNLDQPPGLMPPLVLRATAPGGDAPFEKQVRIEIRRPKLWLPDALQKAGFREGTDSRLCRVGDVIFASILERRVAGQSVRFRLVPETEVGNRRIKTFYVMEQLVTNRLFQEFAREVPDFEFEPRETGGRSWESADESPVTDVYVLEAQRFAQWLGGAYGSLPKTTEWELAAGYYDFLRVLEKRYGKPPSDISPDELRGFGRVQDTIPALNVEVWIGTGPSECEFREPGGAALEQRSPYGCEYNRLRSGVWPTELTATLVDFANNEADLRDVCRRGIPSRNDRVLTDNLYHARLRGLGEESGVDKQLLWVKSVSNGLRVRRTDDLNDAGTVTLLPDGIARGDYIGFRVVLLPEDGAR